MMCEREVGSEHSVEAGGTASGGFRQEHIIS